MLLKKSMTVQIDAAHPTTVSSYGVLARDLSKTLVDNGHESVVVASLMGGHQPSYDGALTVFPQRQQSGSLVSSSSSQMAYNKVQPHLNISVINPRMLDVNIFGRYPNWVAWTPSETDEMMPSDIAVLEKATAIWGMSKFVTESIKRAMPHKNNIFYVPCMINEAFRPYRRDVARHAMAHLSMNAIHIGKSLMAGSIELSESRINPSELQNGFIYGMVGANSKDFSRKGWYEAIQVFALVLNKVPNAWLYLHTSSNQGELWWELAKKLGVAHRVICPRPEMYDHNVYFPKDLALMMSAFDAIVTTSWGEGDMLPAKEASACGTPLIGLEHSAITEHTHKDLLILTSPEWLAVAPQHETMKWWSKIPIKTVSRKWIWFAGLSQEKRDKYGQIAYDYGQSFKGDNVYKNYIAPFFNEFDFNEVNHQSINLRAIMDKWLADGWID